MKALFRQIAQLTRHRKFKKLFTSLISIAAAFVVFVTTYALVLPAITMEKIVSCGIEEHQHDDSCYEMRLICGKEESDGHHHDDSCYSVSKELVCELEEHQHSEENGCYDEEGNLICELPEHVHDDSCYKEVRTLTCGLEESEGHHHTDACYEKVLVCGKQVHTHSAECYEEVESSDQAEEDVQSGGSDSESSDGSSSDESEVTDESSENGSDSSQDDASSENGSVSSQEDASQENGADVSQDGESDSSADNAADSSQDNASGTSAESAGGESAESAAEAMTDAASEETGPEEYVPTLDPVNMDAMLNEYTDLYYFHAEDGEEIPSDSAEITDWQKVTDETELAPTDLVKMYLVYTIPAGSLNETNPTASYRLPDNLHLTDDQIKAINKNENGIYNEYAESDLGVDARMYLGAEAVEGNRRPDEEPDSGAQEYISAVVRVEKTNDGGQELIFTFVPYTIEKNQNTYDTDKNQISAGEKITGWFACDFNLSQIDWVEEESEQQADGDNTAAVSDTENTENTEEDAAEGAAEVAAEEAAEKTVVSTVVKTAEIIFALEDRDEDVEEISRKLTLVEQKEEIAAAEDSSDEDSEEAVAGTSAEEGAEGSADTAEDAADTADTAETADAAGTADTSDVAEGAEGVFKDGALTAEGDGYKITLDYTAAAKIPEGAQLSVREITAETDKEAYEECLKQAGQQVGADDQSIVDRETTRFFDIEIVVSEKAEDGTESQRKIEPAAPVGVNIQLDTAPAQESSKDEQSDPTVLHFAEEGVEQIDSTVNSTQTESKSEEQSTEVQFEAESFSVYGVVYTVDFHYEVNGKMYEFSIPGGGFASFYKIVEVLGISNLGTQSGSGDENAAENSEIGYGNGENTPENDVYNGAEETGVDDNGANGNDYEESISLNNVEVSEATKKFVADVASVEFSSPELVWVGKVEETTTVGGLKEAYGLEVQYSAELTEEQIAEINSSTVEAGDWALISMLPFTSEESLTVTMKNGDQFTVKVTDVQKVEQIEALNVDVNNSYIICYEDGGKYYVLKTDGTKEEFSSTSGFDALDSRYQWAFYYVFKEKDQIHNMDKEYYFIRPLAEKTKTLSLNSAGQALLQTGTNNVGVIPQEGGGFVLEGYSRTHEHDTHLYYDGSSFVGSADNTSILNFYKQDTLPRYAYTVISDDYTMGTVTTTGTAQTLEVVENGTTKQYTYYIAETTETESKNDKKNQYEIKAVPVTKAGTDGNNKYVFDHWELNGEVLYEKDSNGNIVQENGKNKPLGATISANSLIIPSNSSTLKAFFKVDPNYKPTDPSEKVGTEFPDMSDWLQKLENRNIPLNEAGCSKTAEVYDYENRIYRVDLTAQSSLTTFDGTIDLGFIMDVSNSMLFPSKLVEATGMENTLFPIRNINSGSTRWNNNNLWDVTVNINGQNKTYTFDKRTTYYLISDETGTATVYKIFWQSDSWRCSDASKSDATVIGSSSVFKNGSSDSSNGYKYQIYTDGNPGTQRLDDLKASVSTTINAMKDLLSKLNIAAAAVGNSNVNKPDVQIAWTTYADEIKDNQHTFASATGFNIGSITYRNHGGTRTDLALTDAAQFGWSGSATRYAVLITDGAPQNGGVAMTWDDLEDEITGLKNGSDNVLGNSDDIKLITVGLSMDNVEVGRRLLYDMADEVNGEKGFYSAKSGDELEDILLHILQQIMKDATVTGKVTDKINEAFYPVDKRTGKPLEPGNCIDLNGNLVPDSYAGAKGVIQPDGCTVVWENQDFTWDGWQGTVYVKAKEDLLGGNAVLTNDKNSPAQIEAQGYKFRDGQVPLPLAETVSANPHYNRFSTQTSPRVNVNELSFLQNNTEWTVYVGTQVDPKQQIQKLYDSIEVEQVIKEGKGKDTDSDDLPDIVRYNLTDTDNNYYPLSPNSISDQRESEAGENTRRNTFLLKDLIKKLADSTSNGSLSWWDYTKHEIKIDEFITAASSGNGITLDYDVYGLDKDHTDNSTINIRLTSAVEPGEQGLTNSPHPTEVIGDEVEKYTLTVLYSPDYTVTPVGQGGQSTADFKVGTYGTIYQGHAAGTETSENNHIINVYAQPLDVLKTDASGTPLAGAVFELYEKTGDVGTGLTAYDKDLTGSYSLIATVTSDGNGKATVATAQDGPAGTQKLLLPGKTYYLVEKSAPATYERDRTVRMITVEAQDGKYTDLSGEEIASKTYPYNWDQGAKILVDGEPVHVTVKDPAGEENDTLEQTDGSYVSKTAAVSFHTTVVNEKNEITLNVEKTWENDDNPPDTITFDLYRTAYVPHDWDDGVVTKNGSCNEDGEITYTCHNCQETRVVAISAEGHKPSEPVREVLKEATCGDDGQGYYQMVTYCSVCGEELERGDVQTIPALEHDWGDWEVTTPATYDAPGVETRVCKRNPDHAETRPIPKLVKKTHITYRINTFWYRENTWAYSDLYFRQETITSDEEYEVGSQVNLSWTDTNHYGAVIYKDVTPSTGTWGYLSYYYFRGLTPTNASRSGDNYSVNNITVTDGMVIDICLGTNDSPGTYQWDGYHYAPGSVQFVSANRGRSMALRQSAKSTKLRGSGSADVLTAAQLQERLDSYLTKEEAAGHCDVTYYEVEGTYTVTKNAGGEWKWSKEHLPKYDENGNEYTYYVVETSPDTGYETTYLGQTAGLHNGDTAVIHNKLLKGSLLITKNVQYNGRTAETADEKGLLNGNYVFAVKKDGAEISGSPFTITVTNGISNSILIPDLEEGSDYTIEEIGSGTLAFKEASGGTSVSGATVTATVTAGKITEAELLATAKTSFTNNYVAYEVVIEKVDTGNTNTKLGGAKFVLYPEAAVEDGEPKEGAVPYKDNLISSSDEADKGKVSLGTLTPGVYYLFETEAPAGYIIMDMPVKITVNDNHISLMQGTRAQSGTIVNEKAELMVMNSAGAALPNTGGPGTSMLYLFGIMLTGLAGAGLVMKRRRKAT